MKVMHFIRNLIFLFIALSNNSIHAQFLDDTEWLAYNVHEDTTCIKFMDDSIYFKSEAVMSWTSLCISQIWPKSFLVKRTRAVWVG